MESYAKLRERHDKTTALHPKTRSAAQAEKLLPKADPCQQLPCRSGFAIPFMVLIVEN